MIFELVLNATKEVEKVEGCQIQAKTNKKDELYTQLKDIENELRHYKEHFKGKTVY